MELVCFLKHIEDVHHINYCNLFETNVAEEFLDQNLIQTISNCNMRIK